MFKFLVGIISVVIGLFMVLVFNGLVDFLKQVIQIELGKDNTLATNIDIYGIFISIAFGIYIGRKIYVFLSLRPKIKSFKKTILKISAVLIVATILFAISLASVAFYLNSLSLPSDIYTNMLTNMGTKLLILSFVSSLLLTSRAYKGKKDIYQEHSKGIKV